jgi:hypothetical protein
MCTRVSSVRTTALSTIDRLSRAYIAHSGKRRRQRERQRRESGQRERARRVLHVIATRTELSS